MKPDRMGKDLIALAEVGDNKKIRDSYQSFPDIFSEAIRTEVFQRRFTSWLDIFSLDTISTFIELGVDVNRHENEGFAPDGSYPLNVCIHRGDQEKARLLLEHGADPNLCNALNSVSYMDQGAESQIAMAQLVIEFGADVNRELPKLPGLNPLCRAMEKGHHELAEFLKSKGAVMPDVSDIELPQLNLDTFQDRLEKACVECWQTVITNFPDETFCLFGLETDSEFVILHPLFDSEGAVDRDASNRRPGSSYVARISLDCDNEFYGQGKEYLDLLSAELNSVYGTGEGRWGRSRRIKKLLGIFESALKNLDAKGLFGTGPDRERIILLISIIDADRGEWNTMLKVAKRLNPASVYNQFQASLRLS